MRFLLPEDSMREIDVQPVPSDPKACIQAFADNHALVVVSEGALKAYPSSVHWHIRKFGESGTLEATWWPTKNRLWFKVAANRGAAWINAVLDSI